MSARGWAIATLTSGAVHAAAALAAPTDRPRAPEAAPMVVTFDEVAAPDPEQPPSPPPVAPTTEAPAPKAPTQMAAPTRPATDHGRPEVAAAARTLTAPDAPKSEDVADFTVAQGTADAYAGGTTAATGTGQRPGTAGTGAPAASTSQPSAPPQAPRAPAPDLSRAASPAGADWSCSHLFPTDVDAPDSATVRILVDVRADGSAAGVTVLSDPGHGFGPAARRCALGQRFQPAHAADGQPVAGRTTPFVVRFRR